MIEVFNMCEKHNGLKNYETWALVAHESDEYLDEIINDSDTIEDAINTYEESIEDFVREFIEETKMPPFFVDILNGAISDIDFRDIIRTHIPDMNPTNKLLSQL